MDTFNHRHAPIQEAIMDSPVLKIAPSASILVIDDEEGIRDLLSTAL